MSSLKQLKLAQKAALHQKQVIEELETLVKSIERSEKTIVDLKNDLEAVNAKHQNRKSTEDDIAYLTDLLRCANQKLNWEKQLASLKKRTPVILQRMASLVNDPQFPPSDEVRAGMVRALEGVQVAMERLQHVKVE